MLKNAQSNSIVLVHYKIFYFILELNIIPKKSRKLEEVGQD